MATPKKFSAPRMTFSEAKAKVNDHYSGLKLMSLVHHISLPPRFLSDVRAGIREQLNAHIDAYDESANGVLVAYSNVKAMQQTGVILADTPYIHFKVRADAVYFQPQVGGLLDGLVNKVGKDHIGCLVHGRFNVSLKKPRRDCEVKVGDQIVFEVLQTAPCAGLLAIEGRLDQETSNCKRKRTESVGTTDETSSKRAKVDRSSDPSATFEQEVIPETSAASDRDTTTEHKSILDSTAEISTDSSKKKKKKKRRTSVVENDLTDNHNDSTVGECSSNNTMETSLDVSGVSSSKKKKKKSRSSDMERSLDETMDNSYTQSKKKKRLESTPNSAEKPGSPLSVDSAIGSLTNGIENFNIKMDALNEGDEVSGSGKKKKKRRKEKEST